MRKQIIILLVVVSVFGLVGLYWYQLKQQQDGIFEALTTPASATPPTTASVTSAVPTTTSATDRSDMKLYRNDQYGFEFQYPSNLSIKENPYESHYSKFNLVAVALDSQGKHYDVFVINVTTPEFAEVSFSKLDGTIASTTVDGIPGIKYQYEFEGMPETSIVLPLGKYKIILGIDSIAEFYGNKSTFNQILASFKFSK